METNKLVFRKGKHFWTIIYTDASEREMKVAEVKYQKTLKDNISTPIEARIFIMTDLKTKNDMWRTINELYATKEEALLALRGMLSIEMREITRQYRECCEELQKIYLKQSLEDE